MKYCQATVSTTTEFADTLSVILIDFGSEGVTVADYEDIKKVLSEHTWDYADESLFGAHDSTVYVTGCYPEDYDFSALNEKLNELREIDGVSVGTLELSIKKIDSADYENEWKKYYAPIELDRIVIVPEWIDYRGDKLKVLLNPGMAFGTGSHETTALCLRFLEHTEVAGKRVADIGCGSGILGAAALKLGAERCFFADIDPQATEATTHNCALNGVSDRADIVTGSLPEDGGEKYSVILANITADILIMILRGAVNALENGGLMITSGIIHSRADEVKNAYSEFFILVEEKTDGEWRGMLWKKK